MLNESSSGTHFAQPSKPKTINCFAIPPANFYICTRKFNALWSVEVQADSLSTSYFLLPTI